MLLLAVKLRNAFKNSWDYDYTYFLKNIVINGQKRGCSGFVKNNANGVCVYIYTEHSCAAPGKNFMYRFADHEKQYSSLRYRNRFAETLEELVREVNALLLVGPDNRFGIA